MRANSWTDAELAWLREEYPRHRSAELPALMAAAGWHRTEKAIRSRAKALRLRKDEGLDSWERMRAWTPEENGWLREFVPGHTQDETIDAFEARFGRRISVQQLKNRCVKLGVRHGTHGGRFEPGRVSRNKGRTWEQQGIPPEVQERMRANHFRKGQRPANARHLLDERVTKDGYVQVKVDPRNARNTMDLWVSKARFVWMRANGRDFPERHRCLFVDGDRRNFDPANLVAVPDDVYPLVSGAVRGQLAYHDRETLEAAIAYARVTMAATRATKAMRAKRRRARADVD